MARRKTNQPVEAQEATMTDENGIENENDSVMEDEAGEGETADRKMTEKEIAEAKIKTAWQDGMDADQNEDAIKLAMIQAGATFKNVTRLYTNFMIEAGLAMSKEEKEDLTKSILDNGTYDVTSAVGFTDAMEAIKAEGTGISDRNASAIIRAWAKDNNVTTWKKPESAGGDGQRGKFRMEFFRIMEHNPRMTREELSQLIKTHPLSSDNVVKHESVYQRIRQMCNTIIGV